MSADGAPQGARHHAGLWQRAAALFWQGRAHTAADFLYLSLRYLFGLAAAGVLLMLVLTLSAFWSA